MEIKDKIHELTLGFADLVKGLESIVFDLSDENQRLRLQVEILQDVIYRSKPNIIVNSSDTNDNHHSDANAPIQNHIQKETIIIKPMKPARGGYRRTYKGVCECGNEFEGRTKMRKLCDSCYRQRAVDRFKRYHENKLREKLIAEGIIIPSLSGV